MSLRLGSTAESVWRVTRDALVRLNHLVTETGNSDDDLVFYIRRSESNGIRVADRDRGRRINGRDKLNS
jgi:hypothetical protein